MERVFCPDECRNRPFSHPTNRTSTFHRQNGCSLHLRFHRQGPRCQGADPRQGVQGVRRRQGVRVRQQVQGEFPGLTSIAEWILTSGAPPGYVRDALCASVENIAGWSQPTRALRFHWRTSELNSDARELHRPPAIPGALVVKQTLCETSIADSSLSDPSSFPGCVPPCRRHGRPQRVPRPRAQRH